MKIANPPSGLITVTPSRGLKIGLIVTAVIFCLLVMIGIVGRPGRYGPLVWHANYERVALSQIIEDLERSHIIPQGTAWENASIKDRPVTVRWLLADPEDVLRDLASRAVVRIEYPVGYHGNMIGPAKISPAEPSRGSVVPAMDRELERRQLALPAPGA